MLVCPCTIQESEIILSPENIASCDGQSGQGNLLGCQSCWLFAESGARIGRGYLPQVLKSDYASNGYGVRYRRHHPQQFSWRLEALRRVFLQEQLEQNNDWLRDIFELFER